MSRTPRSAPDRTGDPVDGAAALGAGLVGADLAGAGGLDVEPQLLLEGAGDGAADRVVLPAGGLGDLLDRGALGALEQLDHQACLVPARGVGFSADAALAGFASLAFVLPLAPGAPWRPVPAPRRLWLLTCGIRLLRVRGALRRVRDRDRRAVALVMQLDPEVGRAQAAIEQARAQRRGHRRW